jgi:AcrR family transcriptional regulator
METEETNKKGRRVRKTAEERREEILEIAITEFAARGLSGGSVERVAELAGVSQPYVYRLFGTKKELFLAASRRVGERVAGAFRAAAEADEPGDPLEAMGRSYNPSLFRQEEMMMVLQGITASDDPEVREAVGNLFASMWRYVQEAAGASDEEVWNFFGAGMMLTLDAAVGLTSRLGKEDWLKGYMGKP